MQKLNVKVNFQQRYTKLSRLYFPTIRSTQYIAKHGINLGDIVQITIAKNYFCVAELCGYETATIQEIPLEFLKYDAHPHVIQSHEDFVNLLNSFLPEKWGKNRLTTIKRIYWFAKKMLIPSPEMNENEKQR